MNKKYKPIETLYKDNLKCAEEFGIEYCEEAIDWYIRMGKKENFSYMLADGQKISSQKILTYIENLVIPPTWSNVEISPNPKNHILAYGYDEKGRKQYIYHEKWSEARSLVNSYKMIIFGEYFGTIRAAYKKLLKQDVKTKDFMLGAFLYILDETVIRVGNHNYFEENGTIGLATLHSEHVVQKSGRLYLNFVGKSGKEHTIHIKNKKLKTIIQKISRSKKGCIFSYLYRDEEITLSPQSVNDFLRDTSSELISAKDFRTWHASKIVFENMVENLEANLPDMKRKKILLAGFDDAANILGNTRTVIRESYAHGDLVDSVLEKTFLSRYQQIKGCKKLRNLSQGESELLVYIKNLYDENMSEI